MKHANEAVNEVRRAEFFRKGGGAREIVKGKSWLLLTRWVNLESGKKADVPTGRAAIELGASLRPGVAILDLSMPDIGGLQVGERLLELVPGIRIIVLSMYAAAPILYHLRKVGISACLARNEAPKMLVQAVERVLAGIPFFASSSAARQTVEAPEYISVQFLLTPRGLDVQLLARGKSNKELTAELNMSVRTAESHHANIMAKLNVQSLGDLVRIAVRDGVTRKPRQKRSVWLRQTIISQHPCIRITDPASGILADFSTSTETPSEEASEIREVECQRPVRETWSWRPSCLSAPKVFQKSECYIEMSSGLGESRLAELM